MWTITDASHLCGLTPKYNSSALETSKENSKRED